MKTAIQNMLTPKIIKFHLAKQVQDEKKPPRIKTNFKNSFIIIKLIELNECHRPTKNITYMYNEWLGRINI